MTIYAFEAQKSWLPTAIGMTCGGVEFDAETATLTIFLYTPNFERGDASDEPERAISIHGVWRVEQEDAILAASGDLHDPLREAHLDRLVGRELVRADVSHPGFDLALHFTGPFIVRGFPCDSLQFGEDPPEGDDIFVSWWVDGIGVPDDWEEPNEAFYENRDR